MERTKGTESLHKQMVRKSSTPEPKEKEYDGDFGMKISTGSTLLDLAISGGRVRGGGIPGGILIEAFGPSGSGKTVLLSEIAGNIQQQGGEAKFSDPEARLNAQFAKMFGLDLKDCDYDRPDTVTELFSAITKWNPPVTKKKVIHGWFADSLAALSTDLEMTGKDGDKMGMRRAKEFSEQLRKICRTIAQKNYIVACSNQIRVNVDAGQWGQKFITPGGSAMEFYSSLRLRFARSEKIKQVEKIAGKEEKRVIGVQTEIEVFKSSIWKPYHTAPVIILFDYGIDDIRANLQYIKDYTKNTQYSIRDELLGVSMENAIKKVEHYHREDELKNQVIDLWEEIEEKFYQERKPKR